jgi:hypothetical protein
MLTGAHKTQRKVSALIFLERYHKDGDEFLTHRVRVTGDWTCVSFVNVETKEHSKLWMHTHSPNKPRKFKRRSSASQKAGGCWFLGQEMSVDGGIHATRGHNSVRIVLRNTKKKSMTMGDRIELLSLKTCWSISTGCCLTTFPTSIQPWSRSEQLPPVYLLEELVVITELQK